jgi:hypothetical protein
MDICNYLSKWYYGDNGADGMNNRVPACHHQILYNVSFLLYSNFTTNQLYMTLFMLLSVFSQLIDFESTIHKRIFLISLPSLPCSITNFMTASNLLSP